MSPIGTRFGLPPKAAPERAFRRSGSNGGWPLASGMPAAYRNGGLGVFVFGFSLAFTRLAVRELDPTFVAVTRAALAGLAAATYLALVKASPPKAYQVRPLIEVSLCVIFGFPLLSSYAMHDLRATQGAIFNGVMPLLTALFGCIIAKERPSLSFWLCAVAGAGLVGASAWQTGTAEARSGDFAMAAAVLFASFGYARGATLARTMGGPCVISWALVISLPITLTLSLWEGQRHWGQLLDASWGAWVGLAYVALFSMFIGFFFWYRGLALGGVGRIGQLQLLQPFVGLFAAYLVLGEATDASTLGYALGTFAFVVWGTRTRFKSRDPRPPLEPNPTNP